MPNLQSLVPNFNAEAFVSKVTSNLQSYITPEEYAYFLFTSKLSITLRHSSEQSLTAWTDEISALLEIRFLDFSVFADIDPNAPDAIQACIYVKGEKRVLPKYLQELIGESTPNIAGQIRLMVSFSEEECLEQICTMIKACLPPQEKE